MAVNSQITNAVAIAMCDAAVDAIDGGTGAGIIQIYSGTQPTQADDGVGGGTLLAELVMNDPAFGNATDNAPGAIATANVIADDTNANATGTATWYRVSSTNDGATPLNTIMDGSVGTATSNLILNTVNIESGATVKVTSFTVSVPES